jgi:hypothetical protein
MKIKAARLNISSKLWVKRSNRFGITKLKQQIPV